MALLDDSYYIERADKLIEELRNYKEELKQVQAKLKLSDLTPDDFLRFYEDEFELLMLLSGAHHDVKRMISNIKKEENIFIINRLHKTNNELFLPLVIE